MKARLTAKPKNLLVLVSDEHRRDAAGFMGHPVVKTPNLDRLAANGAVFENAYTPSPICVSARAALASGRYVHQTGHWDSAAPYCGEPPGWMHAARQSGVETISFGKLHFKSHQDDNGFCQEVLPMHVVDGVGWTLGLLRKEPPAFTAAAALAADIGAGETDYTRYDRRIADAAAGWLQQRRSTDPPWAAFVSFVSPHYPLQAPEDYFRTYDPQMMARPLAYDAGERPQHPEIQHLARFFAYDEGFDAAKIGQAKAAYFALVSFMDACLGQILAALERSGQRDDTVIIYTSDHGEMLGDHGLWTKSFMYEASVGVPMIAAGPGIEGGQTVRTAANLIDIAATAADIFALDDFGKALPGRSLRSIAAAPHNLTVSSFSEYHDGGSSTAAFMLRWDNWKYVHYVGLPPQLFDLRADPMELIDLGCSAKAAHASARREGEHRLRQICDPEAVNRQAFADQARRIEALGGRQACLDLDFNHTPVPTI